MSQRIYFSLFLSNLFYYEYFIIIVIFITIILIIKEMGQTIPWNPDEEGWAISWNHELMKSY